ncbi:MAG: copper transport protein [Solirubrobacteraceae bacterium]|nr:copper transport protein [Solirubrobacteraceae bacterium]
MSHVRRSLACALIALGVLAASAGPALAHATLLGSTPSVNGRGVSEEASTVTLRFSEPVQILNRSDVSIVDGSGRKIDKGTARTAPGDHGLVIVPMRGPLLPDSYTVRYRVVSADSHAAVQAFVFGVGRARLRDPILTGAGGLSDTGPTAVAARVAELVALGLLLGLLAFRALVWGPAVEKARGVDAAEREAALRDGQRLFWRAFWAIAVLAGVAETTVLAAKSAVVFHTGLAGAVLHPATAYHLVAATRFGDLLGWRGGALSALVAVAFVTWTAESAGAPSAGRRGPFALMALFAVAALTLLADQGHASQAPLAPLSIAADATHLGAAAIWIGGLPCLIAVLLRAPKALPEGGRALASATLSRFSRVALWSVVVISVTGLARMTGELSAPAQLWSTPYGRDLMLKASLLLPMLLLGRRNRRMVASFAGGLTPSAARLRTVARDVRMELMIAGGIIAIAALLVAQVPGRG